MLGEINKPALFPTLVKGKLHDKVLKEANEAQIMRWLTLTDCLRGVIRSKYNVESISYISSIDLCSDIWAKFETLYRETGFMERDAILIRLFSRTASDLSNFDQFVDSLKRDCKRLKEIGTKDVPDCMFTIWLLHGLNAEYDSFCIMLNNSRKAKRAKGVKSEPGFDFILKQILM